jgi:hypothetical protein
MKRAWAKLSITIENFLISQLEEKLELPKFGKTHKIIKSYLTKQTITNSLILILFTVVESTYKRLHPLF